jgi:hypothetical protein
MPVVPESRLLSGRRDLDALAARVRQAGYGAAIIDESYARTLKIPNPDGGEELWINGRQADLHGYSDQSA